MNWLRWLWNWGQVVQPRVLPTITLSRASHAGLTLETAAHSIELS